MPTTTIGAYVAHLFDLGFHPIPLDPFSKVTHQPGWATPGPATPEEFFRRARLAYGEIESTTKIDDWFGKLGRNIGNLNSASRTLILDCDDARAWSALTAAGAAIGIQISERSLSKTTWAVWKSVRGVKMAWKVPKGTDGARLSVRDRAGSKTTYRCIMEFRTGGQDVLPPSVRGDTDPPFALTWASDIGKYKSLPTAPAAVLQVLGALRSNRDAQRAAYAAAGGDPAAFGMDPGSMKGYPPALAACVEERATANTIPLTDLLSRYGYVQNGNRWHPADSKHADGIIIDPDGRTGFCFHESEPISGMLDSWRLMVELSYGGDLLTARAAMRAHKLKLLGVTSGSEPTKPKKKKATNSKEVVTQTPTTERGGDRPHSAPEAASKSRIKPGRRNEFGGISILELHKTTLPEKDWRFRGVLNLTPGLYLLAGKPKHGKTFLAQGMAFAATTGESYAGTRGGPMRVLYISVDELDEAKAQGRFQMWLKSRDCPVSMDKCDVHHSWPRGEAGIEKLEAYLAAYPDVGLIVIDTLVAFRQQVFEATSRGVYQAEADEVHLFAEFANKHRLVMLLLHHMRKGKIDMEDPFDAISGTNGIQGSTDGNIVLHRVKTDDEAADKHVMIWCRTRDHDETDAHLVFKDGVYTHDGGAWVAEQVGTRAMVVETMRAEPTKVWSSLDVYNELHDRGAECGSKQNVANVMHRMGKSGMLVTTDRRGNGKGGYTLPVEATLKPGVTA